MEGGGEREMGGGGGEREGEISANNGWKKKKIKWRLLNKITE